METFINFFYSFNLASIPRHNYKGIVYLGADFPKPLPELHMLCGPLSLPPINDRFHF